MPHGLKQPSPVPPESAAHGYEVRDAAPRPILIFAIGLIATLVLVHIIGWWAYVWLEQSHKTEMGSQFPFHPLSAQTNAPPPDPRLEPEPSHDVLPRVDLAEVRAHEQAMIGPDAWGWVDSNHQFARIPLRDAIELAVKNGLPNILPATQPSAGPFMPPASALHGPGGVP
jgi:hypothetical protein